MSAGRTKGRGLPAGGEMGDRVEAPGDDDRTGAVQGLGGPSCDVPCIMSDSGGPAD
jgi:hypothetical protein